MLCEYLRIYLVLVEHLSQVAKTSASQRHLVTVACLRKRKSTTSKALGQWLWCNVFLVGCETCKDFKKAVCSNTEAVCIKRD